MLTAKAPDFIIQFVTEWPEATLGQFIKLHSSMVDDDEGNPSFTIRSALKAFASHPDLVGDLEAGDEVKIIKELGFIKKIPDFRKEPIPETIAGVKPPLELGTCTLLQKWCVEQQMEYLQEEGKPVNFITMAVPLLSIYLYPLITGKKLTDLGEIDTIKEQVEALPCVDALALSAFFFDQLADIDEHWENEFSTKLPKSPRQKIAESMVPELSAYYQYGVLTAIAEKRRLTDEQTLQLAYDDAMQTLAYLHHTARLHFEMHQVSSIKI